MTTPFDPELDRRLDAWFADGPLTAPDPVITDLPARLARQRQRPGWLVGRDRPRVAAPVRLLAAAAALVAVVIGGSLLVGGGGGVGPGPGPTPTPSPTRLLMLGLSDALEPGTYAYTANGGRTTLTVPDGWRVPTYGPLDFSLAPVGSGDDTVRVFYDMRIAAKDAACSERPEDGVGTSATAIVGDIVANPGIAASTPETISIGGLDGLMVDLALADGWTRSCPFDPGSPAVPLIVDTVAGEGPFWGTGGDDRQRLIVLDHPRVTNVVLLVESAHGSTFEELVAAAMPVLQTFTFE